MEEYLKSTDIINWRHPQIIEQAHILSHGKENKQAIAKACFEWVRDDIKHIADYDISTVTWRSSEVLEAGCGICYAKSHLLAALLRANSLPAGFCYQRLSRDALYLPDFGW
ncbi:MAG: transglutaminase family protein [bacterium]